MQRGTNDDIKPERKPVPKVPEKRKVSVKEEPLEEDEKRPRLSQPEAAKPAFRKSHKKKGSKNLFQVGGSSKQKF